MRLHNFFIGEPIEGKREVVVTDSSLLHQWRHVLRLNVGSQVVLCDNSGFFYRALIKELSFRLARLEVLEKKWGDVVPKRHVTLFLALIKRDRFEWALEKATELGVSRIAPTVAERSVKIRFDQRRAERIIREAAEQSGRATLPVLSPVVSLEGALEKVSDGTLALHPSGPLLEATSYQLPATSFFIGPEGGWTERELALFREKNIPLASLGPATLRTETAALAISSLALIP
ncbi:MAG: 16S ribosomal RNA methyltransferase RsmE [Parcubacteria group bacterium Gr01-1014_72]|nr:MAG: 16S ribosomal RNA methyltransferase RsmE [Parcubacteria group bacterium Gr01-1014_72]